MHFKNILAIWFPRFTDKKKNNAANYITDYQLFAESSPQWGVCCLKSEVFLVETFQSFII